MSFIPQDQPVYKILDEKGFWDGVELHAEGTLIVYLDEPNEDMEPLNDLARARLAAYSAKLDELAAAFALKAGKTFTARPKNWIASMDEASDNARSMKSIALKPSENTPQMPSKVTLGRKRATKVEVPESAKVKVAEFSAAG